MRSVFRILFASIALMPSRAASALRCLVVPIAPNQLDGEFHATGIARAMAFADGTDATIASDWGGTGRLGTLTFTSGEVTWTDKLEIIEMEGDQFRVITAAGIFGVPGYEIFLNIRSSTVPEQVSAQDRHL